MKLSALCLLILSLLICTCSCTASPLSSLLPMTTPNATQGKLYLEFPLEGVNGNVVMEELKPLKEPKNGFVRCYAASDIDALSNLVARGTITDIKEVVFCYETIDGSNLDEHYSIYTIRIDEAYKSAGEPPREIRAWVWYSSHQYDSELEKLPEVGETYYWLLTSMKNTSISLLDATDLADYVFFHSSMYLASTQSGASRVETVKNAYRDSAQSKGLTIDPAVFELTDLDEFLTQYYAAVNAN